MPAETGGMAVAAAPASTGGLRSPAHVLETIMALGGIQVAAMVFTLVRGKVVAVALGTTGIGATSLIDQIVVLLSQLTAFSLPLAGIKFLSAADSDGREEFQRLYGAIFQALLLVSIAGAAVAAALLFWNPAILGADLTHYRTAAVLALASIPGINLAVLLTNAMAASRRTRASGIYGLATAAVLAAFCWAGVLFSGIYGYYAANLAAMSAIVAGGAVYLARRMGVNLRGAVMNPFREFRRYSKIARFSALMYVTSFTSPLSDLLVRYAVLNVGGLAATGLFQAASGLGMILRTVLRPSFSLFLTPALNRRGAPADKLREAVTFLRVLCALIGIGALPLALFPKLWLLLLYSRDFEAAAPAVYLFVLGIAVQLLGAVNIALLLGVDDTPAYVQATVLSDIATAFFAWWLARRLGLPGVGVAFILDGTTTFVLTSWWLWSRHRLPVLRAMGWVPPAVIAAIAAAGAMAHRWSTPSIASSALEAAFCLIFWFGMLRAVAGGDLRYLLARRANIR